MKHKKIKPHKEVPEIRYPSEEWWYMPLLVIVGVASAMVIQWQLGWWRMGP